MVGIFSASRAIDITHIMITTFLVRGMLVGIVAGFLSFGFAKIFAEPQIGKAVAFEEEMDKARGEDSGPDLVSREMQSTFGLLTAVIVYGVALGGLFALAFAFAYGRVGSLRPRLTSLLVAGGGFLSLYLIPALKYPPNPPSVGQAATIAFRTETYFLMILISLLLLASTVYLWKCLISRFTKWDATLIAGLAFIATTTFVVLLLPDINEVPKAFPAVVLWHFRLASIGTQTILWATLGLCFGALTEMQFKGDK